RHRLDSFDGLNRRAEAQWYASSRSHVDLSARPRHRAETDRVVRIGRFGEHHNPDWRIYNGVHVDDESHAKHQDLTWQRRSSSVGGGQCSTIRRPCRGDVDEPIDADARYDEP